MMKTVVAVTLKQAFLNGSRNLEVKKEWINELNVFPVPDGDTGTNMTMTIMAAAREVAAVAEPTMESLARAKMCIRDSSSSGSFWPRAERTRRTVSYPRPSSSWPA